jgi:hypothetical protein
LKKTRKILKKLPGGGFFLHKDPTDIRKINENRRTQLWLSSDFLFSELLEKDPVTLKKTLDYLISWNLSREKYNECESLKLLLDLVESK